MWRLWPFAILASIILWIVIAFVVNHGPSGGLLGGAVGSTTFRDPLFLLAECTAGLAARKWWHAALAAMLLSITYTLIFNGSPLISADGSIRLMPFMGRALSAVFVIAVVAILVDLFQNFSRSWEAED